MRHIEVRDLWLQQQVRDGRVRVVKVGGEANPADIGTKFQSFAELKRKFEELCKSY